MNENFNWFTLLIIFASLQGIFLFFSISRSKKGKTTANKFLAVFILFVSIALFGRFFFTQKYFSLVELKLLFSGDLIIYTFGPLLYFYFLRLFNISSTFPKFVHFIPTMLYIIFSLPFIFGNEAQFYGYLKKVSFLFHYWEGLAIILNFCYVIINWKLLNNVVASNEKHFSFSNNIKFYKILLIIIFISLLAWIGSFILVEISKGNYLGYHLVWIMISGAIISLGYYAISNPEIFIVPKLKQNDENFSDISSDLDDISNEILKVMKEQKPFLDPKLTLNKLAEMVGVSSHLLSKIINDKFGRNFFLFVNDYRVEEFKSLVHKKNDENFTLLALAYDSGFNSKTTFNSAFKKITKLTPREYLHTLRN